MKKTEKKQSGDDFYCWKCGKKIDKESEFCKHCGAPTDTEKAPEAKEGIKPTRKRSRKVVMVFLIIMIIIIAGISIFFIINYEDVDEHEYYKYNPSTTPSSLTVELDMMNGGTEIEFTSDPKEPVVHIDYQKRWTGVVVKRPSFSTSSSKVTFEGSDVWGEANSKLTVTLRNDVIYKINIKSENGGLNLNSNIPGTSFSGISFDTYNGGAYIDFTNAIISGKFKMKSENGGLNVKLTNCTLRDIEVNSKSGGTNIIVDNIEVGSDSTWNIDSDEGGANLNIIQTINLGADVSIDGDATDGGISVNFEYNNSAVRAKFTCKAGGDVEFKSDSGFNSPVGGTMESRNFNNTALDQFLFDLQAHGKYDDVKVFANAS